MLLRFFMGSLRTARLCVAVALMVVVFMFMLRRWLVVVVW